jgi:hypothetical protein
MKYSFILITLIIFNNLFADGPSPHTVMAESGINLYKEPDQSSEILVNLPFGCIINSVAPLIHPDKFDQTYKSVEINGIDGNWIDAEYNGLFGYVFSPFVFRGDRIDTEISENEIRFTREGLCFRKTDYHPDLIWYGLYLQDDHFIIKQVKVNMYLTTIDGRDKFEYECVEKESSALRTDLDEFSIFLFGVNKEMKQGIVPNSLYFPKAKKSKEYGFIFPEQIVPFIFENNKHSLRAFEEVKFDSLSNRISRRYCLEYYESYDRWGNNKPFHTFRDNLNRCSAKLHSQFQTPIVYWVGDLNFDQKADFIIQEKSLNRTGGACTYYHLFLSDLTAESNPIKLIDSTIRCGCY